MPGRRREGLLKIHWWDRIQREHPGAAEFLLFNVLSNCATAVNFLVMYLGNTFFFRAYETIPFQFLIFDYTEPLASTRGFCGFLSFFTANAAAQAVNFLVQKKLVFRSRASSRKAVPRYILLACFLVLVSSALPAQSQTFFMAHGMSRNFAPWAAQLLNLVIQVGVSYPAMKFWIMK